MGLEDDPSPFRARLLLVSGEGIDMEILTTEDVFDRLEQPGPFQRVRHGIPCGSVLVVGPLGSFAMFFPKQAWERGEFLPGLVRNSEDGSNMENPP